MLCAALVPLLIKKKKVIELESIGSRSDDDSSCENVSLQGKFA